MPVLVPFGRSDRLKKAYVIELTDEADYEEDKIKEIHGAAEGGITACETLIRLAEFMSREYGSTMMQSLHTVLPVRRSIRKNKRRSDPIERLRALSGEEDTDLSLNEAQEAAFTEILSDLRRPSLLFGITGSGKTRIYIQLIRAMQAQGKQSIVLIPEISLTYQTVRRLACALADRVSILHSKLSEGERYEQYVKAENGETDVMVGPRSALFAPFENLGLIIIDEEHERSYHSDQTPRYDARELAAQLAALTGAKLVLGSATPSLESYRKALHGTYMLHRLPERAVPGAALPAIHIADMRKELEAGNRSIFSARLQELIRQKLEKKEQIMLFLNRRGYAGFVSCRKCGHVMKCPHCDVSLTAHNTWHVDAAGRRAALLSCHYCGYGTAMPSICPSCGSRYIAPFGTGTQKLEQEVRKLFPGASVMRMDADSTARKDAHEKILAAFAAHEADILLGTQMIVKGHDFPLVTLVGIVAADLSLCIPSYDASERTFQLLTQASGRAGRAGIGGEVVIQSYEPEHYAIDCAARGDYEGFYEREISYRRIMKYPPETAMLELKFLSSDESALEKLTASLGRHLEGLRQYEGLTVIGPCSDSPYKVNDQYRKTIYIKHVSRDIIIEIRKTAASYVFESGMSRQVYMSCLLR